MGPKDPRQPSRKEKSRRRAALGCPGKRTCRAFASIRCTSSSLLVYRSGTGSSDVYSTMAERSFVGAKTMASAVRLCEVVDVEGRVRLVLVKLGMLSRERQDSRASASRCSKSTGLNPQESANGAANGLTSSGGTETAD